ncbi:hypothetical protein SAMN02910447_00494 [Ruminococcus sp. YE71]|uniref:hypothetical protein n=1 Tax=unclassified Ruminococcus TaxID=2608920 RepID=UPI000890847D|nr:MULTISPECIES: hypothetical protein [unclassified Ruminococcus]SDA11870.1 hypothetical protein SAMN02910446_00493 [Ruminococcus sp. YE78]SFW15886.1 hypothetical protein SAMN02910447_00494 [Ruminococcus sp. YE71]
MKIKRLLAGLLAVSAAATMLAGCGGSDDSSSDKGGSANSAAKSGAETSAAENESSADSAAGDASTDESAADSTEEDSVDPNDPNAGDPNDYKFEEIDDGVEKYGRAGIVWMIMDQWDHRKDLDLCATDEGEVTIVPSTNTDVYITGNGTYTVEFSGYHAPEEWKDAGLLCGYLGVEAILDFPSYPDITFWIDECVIDGVTYTFEHDTDPESEKYQVIEDTEAYEENKQMIKIKNGYGDGLMDDASIWKTADKITVTFTIGGLPTDKIENYENEKINVVYGSGSVD